MLATAGFPSLFWSTVAGTDNVALGAARLGLPPAATGALLTSIATIVPVGLVANLFVLGHVTGLLLLGLALWRGRVVPAWAGLLLGAAQILQPRRLAPGACIGSWPAGRESVGAGWG